MKIKTITKITLVCSVPILLIAAIFFFAHQPAFATSDDVQFQLHAWSDMVYTTRWDEVASNPRFEARSNIDQVRGWEWTSGETLTLYVGDQVVTGTVSDPSYIEFNLSGVYDIQSGDVISLTNSVITKTTTVTDLAITGVDVEEDTVSGIAAPGSNVDMWVCYTTDWINTYRHVTADMDGNWVADFSVFGDDPDEQNTFDILPGTWVDSQQEDQDSDATMYGMTVPNPRFEARSNIDQVRGWEWSSGETLTMYVGDQVVTGTVSDPSYIEFNLSGIYDIHPGNVISLTNNVITKTTTVTDLAITGVDVEEDTVSGIATPGSNVDLWACDLFTVCTNVYRHVTVDENGIWRADFSVPGSLPDEYATYDLIPTTWVDSQQVDADGDATMFGLFIPYRTYLPAVNR